MSSSGRNLFFCLLLFFFIHVANARVSRTDQRDAVHYVIQTYAMMAGLGVSLTGVYQMAHRKFRKSSKSISRWHRHYLNWGELQIDTNRHWKRLLMKNGGVWKYTAKWKSREYKALKRILDEHPEYYLDEFVTELYVQTGTLYHPSTVSKVLRKRFGYTLKAFSEKAAQRDAFLRSEYQDTLDIIAHYPDQVIFVDETHKDRNASRRRRAWGKRGEELILSRWFDDPVRYTCIAACNVDGFIAPCCDLVLRDDVSRQGASGTVDRDRFVEWVDEKLCPELGDYEIGQPRSIVVMDNATTHMDPRVKTLINKKGAYLLYLSPYSPDFNPIEKMFSVYKASLKRNSIRGREARESYRQAHLRALDAVTPTIAANEYRHCGVPGMDRFLASRKPNLVDPAILAVVAGII